MNFLTGTASTTIPEVLAAVDQVRTGGPDTVLVTSVVHKGQTPGTLDMIAVDGAGAWSVTTPLLRRDFTGSGDLTSAMFLAALLDQVGTPAALERTAGIVYGVLAFTESSGHRELRLIEAQQEIAEPIHSFTAVRIR